MQPEIEAEVVSILRNCVGSIQDLCESLPGGLRELPPHWGEEKADQKETNEKQEVAERRHGGREATPSGEEAPPSRKEKKQRRREKRRQEAKDPFKVAWPKKEEEPT